MSQLASPQQPVSPFKNITDHIEFAVDEAIVEVNNKKPKRKYIGAFLWENKSANDRKFKEFVKVGVAKANKVYATQIALYQAYMELEDNPCLFTVVNKNTSEIYYELVPFDKHLAQSASDKAVNILTAIKSGDTLPRIAQSKDFFLCRFCDFQNSCWEQ